MTETQTLTAAEVTDELVEVAAEGIWREVAAWPDWQTWEGRIAVEKAHKNDPSYGHMTDRCREYTRAALNALAAHQNKEN